MMAALGVDAGEFLDAAGSALSDAGVALQDASERSDGSAMAQEENDTVETHQLRCDQVYTQDYGDRGSRQWFALVETSTVGISGVDVVLCGRIAQGVGTASCDAPNCTGTAQPAPENCQAGATAGVVIGDDFVRISCGEMERKVPDAPDIGVRFENAKVTIRRD